METLTNSVDRAISSAFIPERSTFDGATGNLVKRAFDIVISTTALFCSAPILFLAIVLIPVQSRGWPLYVQRRVGRAGKVFNIYKLRTMYAGSDSHACKTALDDQRLTPIGKFLRRTNIDELPQLVNILIGDMSVIGPRPLSVDETNYICRNLHLDANYPGLTPQVRPGLVGLEQINRHKEMTYLDRFAYNHEYEMQWSISMDLHIFLRALSICRDVCIAGIIGALTLVVSLVFYCF